MKPTKILIGPGANHPYRSWRTNLIHGLMQLGRKPHYYQLMVGITPNDKVLVLITSSDGEVISQCALESDLMVNSFIEFLNGALAHKKLAEE